MEGTRYTSSTSRLTQLNEQRRALRRRTATLRRISAVVEPLRGGPGASLQDSLVTREGGLERELERMRVLLARVAGRVDGLEGEGKGKGTGGGRKRAVEEVLEEVGAFGEGG